MLTVEDLELIVWVDGRDRAKIDVPINENGYEQYRNMSQNYDSLLQSIQTIPYQHKIDMEGSLISFCYEMKNFFISCLEKDKLLTAITEVIESNNPEEEMFILIIKKDYPIRLWSGPVKDFNWNTVSSYIDRVLKDC